MRASRQGTSEFLPFFHPFDRLAARKTEEKWWFHRYRINTMLHDWILKHTKGDNPPIPGEAISPWKEFLGDYEVKEDSD